jgi:hypothetical protein
MHAVEERMPRKSECDAGARAAPANERNATGRARMTTRTTATEAIPAPKQSATAIVPTAGDAESRRLAATKISATIDPFRRVKA